VKEVQKHFYIDGMTCINCQNKIEKHLRRKEGIRQVEVSYRTGEARVEFDKEQISFQEIRGIVEGLDYSVRADGSVATTDPTKTICLLLIIISAYLILDQLEILNRLVPSQLAESGMGYGMLFVVGLLTSVHCVAMCGGINLSQSIPQGNSSIGRKFTSLIPTLLYNCGRVVSYTLIGFILGLIGMLLGGGTGAGIPSMLQGTLKIVAGVFMVVMGVNMLGIFPWLRRLQIQMPRSLQRKLGKAMGVSRRPFWVGMVNGLMPCGPLQSMQILALASASPVTGALSMFAFSLGTVPLMLGLGTIVSLLGRRFMKAVTSVGAVLVVVLGLAMLSQGGRLAGISTPRLSFGTTVAEGDEVRVENGVQYVNSTLQSGSYPNITVQAGIPVKWTIEAPKGSINGCNYVMLLKEYGIEKALEEGENVIEFTPAEEGNVTYTCWMGMIRGNINVVENSEN